MSDAADLVLKRLGPAAWVRDRLGFTPDDKQALVLAPGIRRGILNCTRQWGKSTVVAAKAVHNAVAYPESLTLVLGPSARQSAEFVRKAAGFVRRLGIRERGDGDNEISLLLPNRARIVGLPGTEATIRGFSAVSLLLIDEAARVSDDLYNAVRPMLAVGGGALWMMSTPWGRQGFFYETWISADPNWLRVLAPATDCPRIDPNFLREERATMDARTFRQEYMCEFLSNEASLFDEEMLRRAIRPDLQPLNW